MEWSYFDTIQRARKGYARAMEPVCHRWNLSRSELDVLLFLANNPVCDRAADVVTGRGMVKSQVSTAVASLEERGLLLRRMDPEDRRTVRLRLTEASEAVTRAGREAQEEFFRRIFRDLSREELEEWNRILHKVQKSIETLEG